MKRFLTASVAALALLLAVDASVRAAPIPPNQIQWTYNWAPSAAAVFADGNPAAGVSFTNEPTKVAVGSSDIVASNIRVFSTATAQSPDLITGSNGNYGLTLVLSAVDNGTPYTATLNFSGNKLGGSFSAENANVSNMFGPNNTQVADLGTFRFTVSLIAYTPPGPPDQNNAGSISAHVTVENISTVGQVPEPSTMLLSGLGLTFLGGAAWRKRRKAAPAV